MSKERWCSYHQRYEPEENFPDPIKYEGLGKMCDLALQEAMALALTNVFTTVTDTGEKPKARCCN